MNNDVIELACGDLQLGVLPGLGGSLAWLSCQGFDLLRRWDGSDSVRRTASFPLVPYSNRIRQGRFCVQGQAFEVPRNFGDHPHSIHGLGWQRPWQVEHRHAQGCLLTLDHDPQGQGGEDWPFAFHAEQRLKLDEQGLHLHLSVHNRSDRVMPAGLGWHPYFARHQGLYLQCSTRRVWLNDADSLPHECIEVPPSWCFEAPRAVQRPGLDNCFSGWDGRASLYWPQARLGISLLAGPGLEHLVIFTPPEPLDFIAVEPVSHLNNAIDQPRPHDHGLVWLAPGHTLTRELHLHVERDFQGIPS